MRFAARFSGFVAVFCLLVMAAHAQLCQGSLGDPIVNITFGSGPNPGSPLTAATTNYQFLATDCPNDGFYTILNSTTACHNNSWHSLASDHTGDDNGYFMLVNASLQPSAFYLDTVRGLCSNTTFEFAAWITNVLKPSACGNNGIQPNLTFTIERTDGTILQTYNSGNIPAQSGAVWKQYGFFFVTPAGVSDVVLRIVNNSQGGCGNDLALDDITFRPCGPDIIAGIQGMPGTSVEYCEGPAHSYVFNGSIMAGFGNPVFQWQQNSNNAGWTDMPGENGLTLQVDFPEDAPAGTYWYRLSATETSNMGTTACRTASKMISVTIHPNPVTTITSNSPVCERKELQLKATGGVLYYWDGPGNINQAGQEQSLEYVELQHAGKYHVLVTSDKGCTTLDSTMVVVNPSPTADAGAARDMICAGEQVPLWSSGGLTYKWTPEAGLSSSTVANPVATPLDTVLYSVVVANQYACTDTSQVLVHVVSRPEVNAGPDKTIIRGDTVRLEGKAGGQDVDYFWTPGTYNELRPLVNPILSTDYVLTAVSALGCGTVTDTVHVFVYKDVFVPNAFTPNGDGVNEVWRVPALNAFKRYDIRVYNRYGQMVYSAKDVNSGWDGRGHPAGVYVYMISIDGGRRMLRGTLNLIR